MPDEPKPKPTESTPPRCDCELCASGEDDFDLELDEVGDFKLPEADEKAQDRYLPGGDLYIPPEEFASGAKPAPPPGDQSVHKGAYDLDEAGDSIHLPNAVEQDKYADDGIYKDVDIGQYDDKPDE